MDVSSMNDVVCVLLCSHRCFLGRGKKAILLTGESQSKEHLSLHDTMMKFLRPLVDARAVNIGGRTELGMMYGIIFRLSAPTAAIYLNGGRVTCSACYWNHETQCEMSGSYERHLWIEVTLINDGLSRPCLQNNNTRNWCKIWDNGQRRRLFRAAEDRVPVLWQSIGKRSLIMLGSGCSVCYLIPTDFSYSSL